ncbi:MAG: biotin--[acetyl-CoA-carboxylase] ligase, partial [Alphaproteobacteria bacterium]|nr:biotin--[acetyl-CoA-carboxylase] ligase [Alphaproteobacteria bacterium]
MSISWNIETYDSVKSTQDIIKVNASIGEPEGLVVQAKNQTKGYGRHGRSWVSKRGNLFLSILLRPSCSVLSVGQISLFSGLALAKTLQKHLDQPEVLSLKWPNDVLLEGKKCAGILIETDLSHNQSLEWLALGVGVNIISASVCDEWSCIQSYAKEAPSINILRDDFLKQIDYYYMIWSQEGIVPIRKEWLGIAYKRGTALTV